MSVVSREPAASPLLDKREVAVWLRFIAADATPDEALAGRRSVERLIQQGRLRAIKAGRTTVVPRAELEAFVERELAAAGEPVVGPQAADTATN